MFVLILINQGWLQKSLTYVLRELLFYLGHGLVRSSPLSLYTVAVLHVLSKTSVQIGASSNFGWLNFTFISAPFISDKILSY